MSRLTSKGQVTIPANIRKRMGLKPGDEVEFRNEGGKTIVAKRPPKSTKSVFERYIGMFPAFPGGIDEINAYYRDLRGHDENE
jgi:antitoxin PrlF